MTYATTFSGIGGWELGLNACGWKLRWQCERDEWCQALLRERFGVPICGDVSELAAWAFKQFGSFEAASVDVLIGSCPCQPFAAPGEGGGIGDKRHLYPAFISAVRILSPRWVLMEQVSAILRPTIDKRTGEKRPAAFGEYVGGLARLGYDCVWHRIPASAVGADHERDRLYIIAYSASIGMPGPLKSFDISQVRQGGAGSSPFMLETNWRNRPLLGGGAESLLCRASDGVPDWAHRIEAIGNAVVPEIPRLIGEAINEIENEVAHP